MILALYVDDMLCFFLNNIEMLEREKAVIAERFKVDDIAEVNYVHGVGLKRNRDSKIRY